MRTRKGISLIELILTVALLGIVIQVVYSVFFVSTASYSVSTNKGFSQQDVRLVSDFITNEIKYVSAISDNQLDFTDNYYSLKVEEVDGISRIVKTLYTYDDKDNEDPSDDEIITSIIKSVPGIWDEITINTYYDPLEKVDIIISKTLDTFGFSNKSGSFELPLSVNLINDLGVFKEIQDLDLANGGILYYSVSGNTETKRNIIISNIPTDDEDNSEGSTDTNSYVVEFVTNTTMSISPLSGLINTPITLNTTLTKTGQEFIGWYENAEFSGIKYYDSYVIKGNATLYAKWIEPITLNKSGYNILVTSKNVTQQDTEGKTFSVGNNNPVQVKLPVVYKIGVNNGLIGELSIVVNGWSGTTGSLEVTAENQFIIINGAGPQNKDGVLDVTVIVRHIGSDKLIQYNFKLDAN